MDMSTYKYFKGYPYGFETSFKSKRKAEEFVKSISKTHYARIIPQFIAGRKGNVSTWDGKDHIFYSVWVRRKRSEGMRGYELFPEPEKER